MRRVQVQLWAGRGNVAARPHRLCRHGIDDVRPGVVRFGSRGFRKVRFRVGLRGFGLISRYKHAFCVAALVPSFQFHHFSS